MSEIRFYSTLVGCNFCWILSRSVVTTFVNIAGRLTTDFLQSALNFRCKFFLYWSLFKRETNLYCKPSSEGSQAAEQFLNEEAVNLPGKRTVSKKAKVQKKNLAKRVKRLHRVCSEKPWQESFSQNFLPHSSQAYPHILYACFSSVFVRELYQHRSQTWCIEYCFGGSCYRWPWCSFWTKLMFCSYISMLCSYLCHDCGIDNMRARLLVAVEDQISQSNGRSGTWLNQTKASAKEEKRWKEKGQSETSLKNSWRNWSHSLSTFSTPDGSTISSELSKTTYHPHALSW